MRLFALVSGLAMLAATPGVALTISSAPPSRDAAQHLKPSSNAGPRLEESWIAGVRPSSLSSPPARGDSVVRYGFGPVQSSVRTIAPPPGSRFDYRDTPAPLSLTPYLPRR
ncbi:MAG: hypothetical protein U1C74_18390 [Phenylobacterium sp.]|nr:hypothetical protein [Phenylobacterium sp.]